MRHGRFELLGYNDAMRGYAYPLVNFGCLAVRKVLSWSAVTVVKLLNSALAGVLFDLVGPRLWQVLYRCPAPPGPGAAAGVGGAEVRVLARLF